MTPAEKGRFDFARSLYLSVSPDYPMALRDAAELEQAHDLLEGIETPVAQELRGWTNVERMFLVPPEESEKRDTIFDQAESAFGTAYELYEASGYRFRQARMQRTIGALGVYECWASDKEVDDGLRLATFNAWTESARLLMSSGGHYKPDGQAVSRAEAVTLCSKLAIRGDTRKPIASLALPATLRQRVGSFAPDIQKQCGRYNWDISLMSYSDRDKWQLTGGLRFDSSQEREMDTPLHPDILLMRPDELVDGQGLPPLNRILDLCCKISKGEGLIKDHQKEVRQVTTELQKRVKAHGFSDFATARLYDER